MNLSINLNSQNEFDEVLSTLEKSKQYFKINSSPPSEIKVEVDHKYYQFLVDKIESIGLSKSRLIEEG